MDLSEWNEYIADDHPPGAPPSGKDLEFLQILNASHCNIVPSDGVGPWYWTMAPQNETTIRFFWRLKK